MSSLRNKTSKAFVWDLVGNYGSQITYFVISIFLARLLSPEDFGIVGMSMVFIALLRVFKDMGFASALIQNNDNTSITYSSIFFVNIVAGLALTIIIYFSAPLVGEFYDNVLVTDVLKLLSITFIVSSLNIVQTTILRKNLNFKNIAIVNLISQVSGGIIGVIAAYKGLGVYALIIQQLSAGILSTILLWKTTEWYPKWEFSLIEVRKLFGFSSFVFASQFINQVFKQLDVLVVGKMFSPAVLGFYSRAESVNSLISKNSVSTFNKVFFPVLSSIKEEEQRFQNVYLKVIDLIGTISIFLTGFFFLCGEELIITLFGKKWEPSVLIFQILILKGFSYPLSVMMINALHAKGKSKEDFFFGLVKKVLQLGPLIFAYFYGFDEFLYALVGVNILSWLLNSLFIKKVLKISLKAQIYPVLASLIVTFILLYLILTFISNDFGIWNALVRVSIFSALYFGYCVVFKKEIIKEIRYQMENLISKFSKINLLKNE